MKRIASMGRGGVGKSSFIAGLARCLKEKGPLLLIDADADQCLAEMVGIDLEREGVKTIAEILCDIRNGDVKSKLDGMGMQEKLDYLLNLKGLYEGGAFDLICLGTKWTEGCYCRPNFLLKEIIDGLSKSYNYVLIDSPAGLEHLNRRLMSEVDDLFLIIGPSKKAFDNADRAARILNELKVGYRNLYLVANHEFPGELVGRLKEHVGFQYAGKLARDEAVARYNFEGESLLALGENSPFVQSIGDVVGNTLNSRKM
jgi:CO dehydrogenase maturation factor